MPDPAPIGVGLVGCGRVAMTRHLPVLHRLARARVVAVADLDPQRRSKAADLYEVPRVAADVGDLLEDPRVEVIAVCVPPAGHAEMVIAALRAGKHVFVEKPLALDMDDCDRMVSMSRERGRRAAVGHSLRWHPHVRKLKADLDDGLLGEVRILSTMFCGRAVYEGPAPEWRMRSSLGGSAFFEMGIHHLDLWRFLTGREVEEVSATATANGGWNKESAVMTGRLQGGALAVTALAQGTTNTNEIELVGSHACARSSPYRFDGLDSWTSEEPRNSARSRLRRGMRMAAAAPAAVRSLRDGGIWMEGFRAQWEDFLTAVREDREPACSLEEGRAAVGIALAGVASARLKRPVQVRDAPRRLSAIEA